MCAPVVPPRDAGPVCSCTRPLTGGVEGEQGDADPVQAHDARPERGCRGRAGAEHREAVGRECPDRVRHGLRARVAGVVVRDRHCVEPGVAKQVGRAGLRLERVRAVPGQVQPGGQRRLEIRDRKVGGLELYPDPCEDRSRMAWVRPGHAAPEHHVAAEDQPNCSAGRGAVASRRGESRERDRE